MSVFLRKVLQRTVFYRNRFLCIAGLISVVLLKSWDLFFWFSVSWKSAGKHILLENRSRAARAGVVNDSF